MTCVKNHFFLVFSFFAIFIETAVADAVMCRRVSGEIIQCDNAFFYKRGSDAPSNLKKESAVRNKGSSFSNSKTPTYQGTSNKQESNTSGAAQ